MSYTLTVNTQLYAPLNEGGDDLSLVDDWTDVHEFDHLVDVAYWLEREGIQSPSVSSPGRDLRYTLNDWLTDVDPYDHPYNAILETRTAHAGDGFTEREWNALVHSVRWPGH